MTGERGLAIVALWMLCATAVTRARADAPSVEAPEALAAFVEGTQLVRQARWSQALGSFERAAKIKAHAVTTYNIGACERAMGRYTRARRSFVEALAQNEASGGKQLPESLAAQTQGYLAEIDGLLARVSITLVPGGAAIAVDGRPLEPSQPPDVSPEGRASRPDVSPEGRASRPKPRGRTTFVGGTRPPGPAEPAPAETFDVLLDPGAHVFTLSRKGFSTAIINRTLAPGTSTPLRLELDRLPATIHVGSNVSGAIVTINAIDVGPAPVDISRPAGSYRVVVKKPGMVTYEAQVAVQPGEDLSLKAKLLEDKPALTERWWFWTAAGAVVAGAAVGTYLATRSEPEPTRAEVSGGSFGWKVRVP